MHSIMSRKHIIYRAVSPDGEEYIGRTSGELSVRRSVHESHALSAISVAIRKHGGKMKWEVVSEGDAEFIRGEEKRLIAARKPVLNRQGVTGGKRWNAARQEAHAKRMREYHANLSPEARAARGERISRSKQQGG